MSTRETARALWFVGPRRVELREEELRRPAPNEVVARALASGVSQGTEMLLYRGEGPEIFDPSLGDAAPEDAEPEDERATPRPVTAASTYPRRYGYAWVGEIVSGAGRGTRGFALVAHGEAHTLEAGALRPIGDLPPRRAVLAANLETAVTCTWDAEIGLGDRAVVLGGGVVGALTAWLLARSGAEITLVERSAKRRLAAAALLPHATIVAEATPAPRADVVVEATGDPHVLDAAIAWARPEARVVVASFYGARRAPIDLGDAFHRRRLQLRASQVSSIPPRLRERWSPARRWELVLSLLEEPALDALLAPTPFERAAELYASLDHDTDTPPAHVFVYR